MKIRVTYLNSSVILRFLAETNLLAAFDVMNDIPDKQSDQEHWDKINKKHVDMIRFRLFFKRNPKQNKIFQNHFKILYFWIFRKNHGKDNALKPSWFLTNGFSRFAAHSCALASACEVITYLSN